MTGYVMLSCISTAYFRERQLIEPSLKKNTKQSKKTKQTKTKTNEIINLRTVSAFVTAHTFCASRDTRVSYGWYHLIQGYFCAV